MVVKILSSFANRSKLTFCLRFCKIKFIFKEQLNLFFSNEIEEVRLSRSRVYTELPPIEGGFQSVRKNKEQDFPELGEPIIVQNN